MAILRKCNKEKYTTILHSITTDTRLSLKDLGLLVKLLSLPDNWNFSEKGLEQILEQDGQVSIRTAIKNLEKYGYLKRVRVRGENGKVAGVEWYIFEEPQVEDDVENPHLENPNLEFPNLESQTQYNINKYNINKYNIKNKVSKKEELEKPENQTKKKQTKEKSFDKLIDEYTDDEELRRELKEHLKTRKAKKGALTNRAIELSLKRLDKLAQTKKEKIRIVQQSIENGWTGFFELSRKEQKLLDKKQINYDIDAYENYDFIGLLENQLENSRKTKQNKEFRQQT